MTKYCLEIMYKGRDFFGFQSQKNAITIQDTIEKALHIIFKKHVRICGASRTDTGVHAFKQFATFSIDQDFDLQKCLRSLNGLLPKSIGIKNISQVNLTFDPIRSARTKIYRYRLYTGKCYNPFIRDYVWEVSDKINLESIEQSCKHFIGQHDFTSFCSVDSFARSKVREIYDIQCFKRKQVFEIWFLGGGFLKQMIRIIAGTLVDVGLAKKEVDDIPEIILSQKREFAGKTAPAKALTLIDISYSAKLSIEQCYSDFYEGECF